VWGAGRPAVPQEVHWIRHFRAKLDFEGLSRYMLPRLTYCFGGSVPFV
jgi:hypothetical protein